MNRTTKSCEYYEQLISQWIDDEIDAKENFELERHLGECERCDTRRRNFAQLNGLVYQIGTEPRADNFVVNESSMSEFALEHRVSWKSKLVAITTFFAAACLAFVMVDFGGGVVDPMNELDPDIVTPIVRLTEINSQRIHDQELMRESIEYDLRTMKMQVQLANAESKDVVDRIEVLLKKIKRLKNPPVNSYQEL